MGNENCAFCNKIDEKLEEGQLESLSTLHYSKHFIEGLNDSFASSSNLSSPLYDCNATYTEREL